MDIQKSAELYSRAVTLMPGGVNSPVRAFGSVGGNPLFIKSAQGSKIIDVDGNTYTDYVCSWGPSILGHAHPQVINAVKTACENGLTFGAPTENEVILAKMIKELIPSMEMSRLVCSGTEAVMSALRAARGFTHRDKIVKFRGNYHGHADSMLVKAGSGALTGSTPDSGGVPYDYAKHTIIAEYNDISSVEAIFEKYADDIAAVIVEPVAANMGVVLPEKGFLSFLRDITKQNGSLLIFDEVITGFRLSLGGAQEYYGVTPDMTTLGKIVGGGMPIGAYGGRRDIMENIAPVGKVYQAGTLSGNPVATTAGIETLSILKNNSGIYENLAKKSEYLAGKLQSAAGEKAYVNQVGSLICVFFSKHKVKSYADAVSSDTNAYSAWFRYMLNHGIYLAPSQFEAMFVSSAHTDDEINEFAELAERFFKEI